MPHVIWHCNGIGAYSGYEQRRVDFHEHGMSLFGWVRPAGMSDRKAARVNRRLEIRRQRQLKIIAKATGGAVEGNGVGPVAYQADVAFPAYEHAFATYNWSPSHAMPRTRVLKIDARLERIRQEQLAIMADATGGSIYGDGSMHEGHGQYPHTDPPDYE